MRLLNYIVGGQHRAGAKTEAGIVDLTAALRGNPVEVVDILQRGSHALEDAQECVASARSFVDPTSVHVLAPILRPGKFLGVGGNFMSHIDEVRHLGFKTPEHPIWFNKQVTCVNGPFDPIYAPRDSNQLDYEGELGIVIGKRCRRVSVSDALEMVAGYVVCNDVSIRDWQLRAPTATIGKSFDTHGPFGPHLVTPDEIADPGALRIRTWVNGELRQDGSTSEMIFSCAALISDLSQRCTLEIGDVLSVGSPAGVGGLRNPPAYLRAGDVVRVEIDRIGAIENIVCEEPS
ncbi:fumarylacetoacetate hydrolase family protein [Paraburkholderia sp. BCC1884]|uniref:fumarylacetoacetate hydrolase family protein n=1 Tax=Paraburkholderia sp. BCC1884 TaxID=2562668 RepID=UPI0011823BE7|nr:fumarylacetoacetate hydrolase family protein [Paraburkholderia sp. BCC1884]